MKTIPANTRSTGHHFFIQIDLKLGFVSASMLEDTVQSVRDFLPRDWEYSCDPEDYKCKLWFRSLDPDMAMIARLSLTGYTINVKESQDAWGIFWWKEVQDGYLDLDSSLPLAV